METASRNGRLPASIGLRISQLGAILASPVPRTVLFAFASTIHVRTTQQHTRIYPWASSATPPLFLTFAILRLWSERLVSSTDLMHLMSRTSFSPSSRSPRSPPFRILSTQVHGTIWGE